MKSHHNLFAIVEGFEVRRLPVSRDLQRELTTFFAEQRAGFFAAHPEKIAFAADYTPEDDQLLFIEEFGLPELMQKALRNPLVTDRLVEEELPDIHGLFMGDADGREVSLQVFDRRRLLSTAGFSLVLAKDIFRKLEEGGLTLNTKLAAAVQDGHLYFHSFAMARRLFDLSKHFKEATDTDLGTFKTHKSVLFEDPDSLVENADSWVRRKVTLILQSGILNKERPARIAAVAEDEFGLLFQVQTVKGQEKLLFPSEKKALKEMLHFLDADYLTYNLTGDHYLSNSKRHLLTVP